MTGLGSSTISSGKYAIPDKNIHATTIDANLIAVDFQGGVLGTRADVIVGGRKTIKVVKLVPVMEEELLMAA